MTRVRIYHDFNKLEGDEPFDASKMQNVLAPPVYRGTVDDLEQLAIELQDGMLVTLCEPDDVDEHGNPDCLEVNAVIRRSPKGDYWVGEFNFSELYYASKKNR